MKRCPTCSRIFTEAHLTFCTEDGTPLIDVEPSADEGEATIVSASPSQNDRGLGPRATQGQRSEPTDWPAPGYQPPGQFRQPPDSPKRSAWPWVLGTLAVVFLALLGVGIAAAIIVPDIMKAKRARRENIAVAPVNTRPNQNGSQNANLNANSNTSSNAGVANGNDNRNINANSAVNTPAPENQELVLADLKRIEEEWTVANLTADKKKLAFILAEDYVGVQDGVLQGKAEYLRDAKPDPAVSHWDFRNLHVALNGNRATLTGIVRFASSDDDGEVLLNFVDKFVWRDGRWQAVASEVSPVT